MMKKEPKTHLDVYCLDRGLEKIADHICSLESIRDDTWHLVPRAVINSIDLAIQELEYAKKHWRD